MAPTPAKAQGSAAKRSPTEARYSGPVSQEGRLHHGDVGDLLAGPVRRPRIARDLVGGVVFVWSLSRPFRKIVAGVACSSYTSDVPFRAGALRQTGERLRLLS